MYRLRLTRVGEAFGALMSECTGDIGSDVCKCSADAETGLPWYLGIDAVRYAMMPRDPC